MNWKVIVTLVLFILFITLPLTAQSVGQLIRGRTVTGGVVDIKATADGSTKVSLDTEGHLVGRSGYIQEVNASGQAHVVLRGQTVFSNSTTTPLASAGTYIGSSTETLDYAEITVTVYADQDGSGCLQFSSDGENWLTSGTPMNIYAGIEKTFSFQPERRYFRTCYTNNGTSQSVFDLETTLHKVRGKPSSHNINVPIVGDDDAELVKAVLTGLRDDGNFDNATLSNSNRLKVVSQQYGYAVSEGDIAGHSPVRRFGHNISVGTAIETIDETSDLYVYLTSAEILKVMSDDVADSAGGTGATSVFVQGLDANYNLQNEVVVTDGATPTATIKPYLRVLAFYNFSVGSSAANVGEILLTNTAGTNILAKMKEGEGRASAAIFTVPAGYALYITKLYGSENSSKGTDISFWKRDYGDGGWQMVRLYTILDNVFEHSIDVPLKFEEKSDIDMRAKGVLAGGNVAGGFFGWMETED